MVFLITNSCGDLRGIGLLEVLWKRVTGLLNRNLTTDIGIHDTFHGFRSSQGTGTAFLEAKLIQQLTEMRDTVIYEIFLFPHKAYYALYRDQCLEIMEG